VPGVGRHTEHALSLVVVGAELTAPVGEVGPLPVAEERVGRPVQGVGVVQRATSNTGAGEYHEVAQQMDALDAVTTQGRSPQELA
jgi:hypothetical protein